MSNCKYNFKFGARLVSLRKEKDFTQADIAKGIGVTDKAVSKWERGLSFPDLNNLCLLAEFLDVTVSELIAPEKPDEKEIENNLLKINGMLLEKELKKSRIMAAAAVIITVTVLALLLFFGNKYYRWHYEDTVEIFNRYPVASDTVRMKYIDGYKAEKNGKYIVLEPVGEVCIAVDIDEDYSESPRNYLW